jgi:hypothetical protein
MVPQGVQTFGNLGEARDCSVLVGSRDPAVVSDYGRRSCGLMKYEHSGPISRQELHIR